MESITAYSSSDLQFDNIDYVEVPGQADLSTSVFYFMNINRLIINGSEACPSIFSENYGSVFEIIKSKVALQGVISFHDNTANHGPAFQLLDDTIVYLQNGLRANFTNNKAKSLGGAIYAT
uniref:Receptor L-domain domain-containing protein n=1 Tax=Amphimedon queenslandica TaxID=400682 RepID=A0A1X7T0P4_AMPQE